MKYVFSFYLKQEECFSATGAIGRGPHWKQIVAYFDNLTLTQGQHLIQMVGEIHNVSCRAFKEFTLKICHNTNQDFLQNRKVVKLNCTDVKIFNSTVSFVYFFPIKFFSETQNFNSGHLDILSVFGGLIQVFWVYPRGLSIIVHF